MKKRQYPNVVKSLWESEPRFKELFGNLNSFSGWIARNIKVFDVEKIVKEREKYLNSKKPKFKVV